jgi:hypothetical protein
MTRFLRRILEIVVLSWPLCGWPLYWEGWNGCCGCGLRFADVLTAPRDGAPRGEHYCWACADEDPPLTELRVLRERRVLR